MMYCPFGIDVAFLMLFVRRVCHKLGVVPRYIQDTSHSHSATMNQMWVQEDEWIDTLQWQEDEAKGRNPGNTDTPGKRRCGSLLLRHWAGTQISRPAYLPGGGSHACKPASTGQ
jgi:hypothetical protein